MPDVKTALSLGLATVFLCFRDEVSTIVLAGVSAQTTWEIIEKAPWVLRRGGPRLVIGAGHPPHALRRWLWEHGFSFAADRPVQAAGRWYAVMAAEYTGEVNTPTLPRVPVWRTGRWPEGKRLRRMAEGKAAPAPPWRAGWQRACAEMDEIIKRGQKDDDGTADIRRDAGHRAAGLAERWDNPGLLVDCGGQVSRVLAALDITPEVVAEAAAKQCEMIVSHHPVIFDPLKKISPQDVPFQLVQAGISAICMHTNLDAAEGGVNEVLAGIFDMKNMETFAEGCGRVGAIEEIAVPELARKAQQELAARCNAPAVGPAVQVKFVDAGKPVKRLAVISGAGGSLFADAIAMGADCLLTGEANHHHAIDAKRLGLSLIAAGHYATEFPVTAAVAAKLRAALPELEVLVSTENRDPYTYL